MTTADLAFKEWIQSMDQSLKDFMKINKSLLMHLPKLGLSSPIEILDQRRYLGPEVPQEDLIWQDVVPKADYEMVEDFDIEILNKRYYLQG